MYKYIAVLPPLFHFVTKLFVIHRPLERRAPRTQQRITVPSLSTNTPMKIKTKYFREWTSEHQKNRWGGRKEKTSLRVTHKPLSLHQRFCFSQSLERPPPPPSLFLIIRLCWWRRRTRDSAVVRVVERKRRKKKVIFFFPFWMKSNCPKSIARVFQVV